MENREDLEHVQKSAVKIILGQIYKNYHTAFSIGNVKFGRQKRAALFKIHQNMCFQYLKKN